MFVTINRFPICTSIGLSMECARFPPPQWPVLTCPRVAGFGCPLTLVETISKTNSLWNTSFLNRRHVQQMRHPIVELDIFQQCSLGFMHDALCVLGGMVSDWRDIPAR